MMMAPNSVVQMERIILLNKTDESTFKKRGCPHIHKVPGSVPVRACPLQACFGWSPPTDQKHEHEVD